MKSINHLDAIAAKAGFQSYSDFAHEDIKGWRVETLTCIKGKYSGEVLDITYEDNTGIIVDVVYSTQFKGQEPTFKFSDI